MSLKVLQITDNALGHTQSTSIEDENVQVVFLPINTASLLQPLYQGIIRCVKTSYTRQVVEMILAAIDTDPKLQVMDCGKSFSIADGITFVKPAKN